MKRLAEITSLWNKWGMSKDKAECDLIMIEINKLRGIKNDSNRNNLKDNKE